MTITHEQFQKARRISRAIQEHLEDINNDGLRSTDLYPILARKNLIEKDKNNGSHFRAFLKQLKSKGVLHIIPQCKPHPSTRNPKQIEWLFYRVQPQESKNVTLEDAPLIVPKMSENEIDELIIKAKTFVENLPKKPESAFTLPQLETRKLYERAYEIWSDKELKLMHRAYEKFGRADKVAQLLKRQPSMVRKKLNIEY